MNFFYTMLFILKLNKMIAQTYTKSLMKFDAKRFSKAYYFVTYKLL